VLANLREVEVHCFEPNPATAERLRKRFLNDRRVIVNAVGVGEESGYLPLYDYAGSVGSEHASFVRETFTELYVSEFKTIEVPLVTVDESITERGVNFIDLTKIDVEGSERGAFIGMAEAVAQGRIDVVQFEFNGHHAFTGLTLHEIAQLLPKHDIHKILADGTVPVVGSGVKYNPEVEIYRYSNYVAVRPETDLSTDGYGR